MIKITLTLPADSTLSLHDAALRKIGAREIRTLEILKKSVDARKKEEVKIVYTVAVETENDKKYLTKGTLYQKEEYSIEKLLCGKKVEPSRPVVVGTGPAGLFCALALAQAGAKPIVLERGEQVDKRVEKVENFYKTLTLDTECNVQFGEGGAGTFSDGKLNTNLHNEYIPVVLAEFIKAGAPEEIAYLAKPHIGTDILRDVVKNIRQKIISYGGEIFYSTKMTDIETEFGTITVVHTSMGRIPCSALFLAIGHSSRDTFEMLYRHSVKMETKIYSMGVRIEHLRSEIDKAQYGKFAKILQSADYKMATSTPSGNSLYTFCMCPGGQVVNASSEEGGVCVNGMSYFARDDVNSNSALLVNVGPEDWHSDHPLSGMEYQRKYERLTYRLSGGYKPIVQRYGDFVKNRVTDTFGAVCPSIETGFTKGNLAEVLPEKVVTTLKEGIPMFGKKLHGFDNADGVLTGIEARSSSPVRILRDENYLSSVDGLYPLGEGAGYAGGITSAAIDGLKGALTFINQQ